jgi:hypothetical protein
LKTYVWGHKVWKIKSIEYLLYIEKFHAMIYKIFRIFLLYAWYTIGTVSGIETATKAGFTAPGSEKMTGQERSTRNVRGKGELWTNVLV